MNKVVNKIAKKFRNALLFIVFFGLTACHPQSESNHFRVALTADYPPFEYNINGELHGFDIDLARLIAKELGKEIIFEDMQFSAILASLQNGHVDAAISTITVTEERKQHFDFSNIYYIDGIAAVYKDDKQIKNKADLVGMKIACQLGTTMEIWLKKNGFANNMTAMDSNPQAIEALKADHVNVVLMDRVQAYIFSKKNPHLSYQLIEQSEDGYAVALQKGSPLLADINQAIEKLKKTGEIIKLEEKWLKGEQP